MADTHDHKIVKRKGEKEAFDERKLYASIFAPARQTGYTEQEAETLAENVTDQVKEWIHNHEDDVFTSDEIQAKVREVLEKEDTDVAFMYTTFEEMMR